jgi:hypothetical protein
LITRFRDWLKESTRAMREGEMMILRNMAAALLLATGMMLMLLPAVAHAFELSGAWATHDDLCKLVFTKKGSEVVFCRAFGPLRLGLRHRWRPHQGEGRAMHDQVEKAGW